MRLCPRLGTLKHEVEFWKAAFEEYKELGTHRAVYVYVYMCV